jgi:hypothetical protein
MSREVRIIVTTIGILLCLSAIALPTIVSAAGVWPWVLLYASVGIGLMAGAIAAKDSADREARQRDGSAS